MARKKHGRPRKGRPALSLIRRPPVTVRDEIVRPAVTGIKGPRANGPPVWPTTSTRVTTSPHGSHNAIDVGGTIGDPIFASAAGVITAVLNQSGGLGLNVRLLTDVGEELVYGHLSGVDVKVGDRVAKGEVIGALGNTGNSTGPHLHFEVRRPGPDVYTPGYLSTTTATDPYDFLSMVYQVLTGGTRSPEPVDLAATKVVGIERPIAYDSVETPALAATTILTQRPLARSEAAGAPDLSVTKVYSGRQPASLITPEGRGEPIEEGVTRPISDTRETPPPGGLFPYVEIEDDPIEKLSGKIDLGPLGSIDVPWENMLAIGIGLILITIAVLRMTTPKGESVVGQAAKIAKMAALPV